MTFAKRSRTSLAAVLGCTLMLAACGDTTADESAATPGEPGTQTIAAMIAENDQLSSVDGLLRDAGLSGTFDAAPHYTVFAPTDEALGSLGEEFTGEEAQAALIAVLREHVVPGYLTPDDIANAIEANAGPVEMATMGSGTLTFAMDGDTVTVAGENGEQGSAIGSEMLGANGVVVPIDTVLKDLTPGG
ncbi:fasciclin domain-containing protein [Aurantiacibacter sediminis]|uniref:Fasciclin domain-containing protein n=1 Tax=Aurantiacibacter sediminis TaxID=2793064 RepID=A0ABS0N6D0_9SPHN|nr:fasciclin domain-containing protein [Aurantiacibacter sediminis]MBH5323323.1 fasciclin domain-containing protein [Aurantiacibacter sediminis]